MINKQEVQHIAKLARLGLTQKEIGKFQKELSAILGYIEKLNEVDVSNIMPTSHSVRVENIMREDSASVLPENRRTDVLLAMVPETKNGYVKVKSILK